MATQHLAVIGAGPKAAAIAAKAFCLRITGLADIRVDIFERTAIGANWSGTGGYTDGVQRLCTPAVRDLGFPYDDDWRNAAVAQLMYKRFSWPAFLVQLGDTTHTDWVDRGCKPPRHGEFVRYLEYAIEESRAQLHLGNVKRIGRDNARWSIIRSDLVSRREKTHEGYDGVVFTGPGPARQDGLTALTHPALFNGVNFWSRLTDVRKVLKSKGAIVIIGAGGTSAAIAAWLTQNGHGKRPIHLVAEQGTLFSRSHNYFENRIFSDPETWSKLGSVERATFDARLNRGVVWDSVMDVLEGATGIDLVPGRALKIRSTNARGSEPLIVDCASSGGEIAIYARLVVNASGFDRWWFRELLPQPLKRRFGKRGSQQRLEKSIDRSLGHCLTSLGPLTSETMPGTHSRSKLGPVLRSQIR